MNKKTIRTIIIAIAITAAVPAAVIFNRITAYRIMPAIFLPSYSMPADKTDTDTSKDVTVIEKGRSLVVYQNGTEIWRLPVNVAAQDFLLEDIDHDDDKELLVLCWKRGRFGKHRPTWITSDELGWSQHIYIYEIENGKVRPKWMASDIGMQAKTWWYFDDRLYIRDTEDEVSCWIWKYWGLEKL